MRIFISYRRDDSGDVTGRIYDRLESRFGRESLFIDVDSIPIGVDFREHLSEAVGRCDVLLAVIGTQWLNAAHQRGARKGRRRLDDPADLVRIEIQSALERRIPVVPVLVGNAAMPLEEELPPELRPLAYRNAAEIRPGRDFRDHVERLVRDLESIRAARVEAGQRSDPTAHCDRETERGVAAQAARGGGSRTTPDSAQAPHPASIDELDEETPELSVPGDWDAEGPVDFGEVDETAALTAHVVHMSEAVGCLADLTLPQDLSSDRIDIAFRLPADDGVLTRISLDISQRRTEPVRYFCLNGLKLGPEWWTNERPVMLRVYRSLLEGTSRRMEPQPGVRIARHGAEPVAGDDVGVLVKERFRPVIRAGASLPCLRKSRVRTSRDNQRAMRLVPAIVSDGTNRRVLPTLAPRVGAIAKAGVAWVELSMRIDPDGRLTIWARDPILGTADPAVLIVG